MSSKFIRPLLGTRKSDPSMEELNIILDTDPLLNELRNISAIDFESNRERLIQEIIKLKIASRLETKRNDVLGSRIEKLEAINASLEEKNENLHKDQLTGLFSRAYLPKVLEKLGPNKKYSLLFIDLNLFKSINDTYGHDIGDQALMYLSSKIKQLIRGEDMIAKCENDEALRWAGDEFIILLPDTSILGAISVAERLNDSLRIDEFRFIDDENNFHSRPISLSTGISSGEGADSFSSVLVSADKATYKVKNDMNRQGIAITTRNETISAEEYKKYINQK